MGVGGANVTLKGPGGFVAIDATGVTISGTLVKINAGGSPGMSQPAKPKDPLPARRSSSSSARRPDGLHRRREAFAEVGGFDKLARHALAGEPLATPKPNVIGKSWSKTLVFAATTVFQRDNLFDPTAKDKSGRTNLARMGKGLAPLGKDGKSVNLHHLIQSEKGSIAEVSDTMHKQYDRVLHINPKSTPSGIDRKQFNTWKRGYWKQRAAVLEKGGTP